MIFCTATAGAGANLRERVGIASFILSLTSSRAALDGNPPIREGDHVCAQLQSGLCDLLKPCSTIAWSTIRRFSRVQIS
jgi:hypothetical protein